MNLLTFDIEEWYIEKTYLGNRKNKYREYDRLLDNVLQLLEDNQATATFFCLGQIALQFPDVVKKIAVQGHEIGSHSHEHKWVNKMTRDEFSKDTYRAVNTLENLTGKKVRSFRAPAFSIMENNKWAFEVLVNNGIENDASIFPSVRDYGGFPAFKHQTPCIIEYNGIHINEFPIPMAIIPILGKKIAYSGGGYFRFLPLRFVEKNIYSSDYSMCYFHINDLICEKAKFMTKQEYENYFKEVGTFKNRFLRYFKTNIGRSRALTNLNKLVSIFLFSSIEQYLSEKELSDIIKL